MRYVIADVLVMAALALCLVIAAAAAGTLCGCDGDNGRATVDGRELRPADYPLVLVDVFPASYDAADWWNQQTGRILFSTTLAGAVPVFVEEGITGGPGWVDDDEDGFPAEDPWGVARLRVEAGLILECRVTYSYLIAYHSDTVRDVITHELGHCLGLADDGRGLCSIMGPGMCDGLTPGDRALVVGEFDAQL